MKLEVKFTDPTEYQQKAIRRRVHRYWVLSVDKVDGLMPWLRWYELSNIRLEGIKKLDGSFPMAVKHVLDIIDNKVIHNALTLRELHMMHTRRWPLKEKMLEIMADRDKAKKSKRTLNSIKL